METTIAYWSYMGVRFPIFMEKKMEITIVYWSYIGAISSLHFVLQCSYALAGLLPPAYLEGATAAITDAGHHTSPQTKP